MKHQSTEKINLVGASRIIISDELGNTQHAKLPKKAKGIHEAVLDRSDGPAIDYANTYKAYYKDGKLHRDDGPAVEFCGKACSYWKNGIKVEAF